MVCANDGRGHSEKLILNLAQRLSRIIWKILFNL